MVTTLPLGLAGLRLPNPRNGVTWAIGFSVLLHIALGWYFVSRLMIASVHPEPLPVVVEIHPPIAPPKPPPPPEVETDKIEQKIRDRKPVQRPVKPVEGAAVVDASPIEAGPPVEADPVVAPGPAVPASAPKPTRRVEPDYPGKALDAEKDGDVEVYITVNAAGAVADVQVVNETPKNYGFGKAAIAAVRRWEFAGAAPGNYSVKVKFRMGH